MLTDAVVGLVRSVRRRRAIRRYARRLPALLRRRFGALTAYSPEQIKATIADAGLSSEFDCYALCIFGNEDGFAASHQRFGEVCDYAAMRAEVANLHFHGNIGFTVQDASEAAHSDAGHHDGGVGDDTGGHAWH